MLDESHSLVSQYNLSSLEYGGNPGSNPGGGVVFSRQLLISLLNV